MASIIVDTYKLNQYAQRISDVNQRIECLELRLNGFYSCVGVQENWSFTRGDLLTSCSWQLLRCKSYLQQAAVSFDSVERNLIKEKSLNLRDLPTRQAYTAIPLPSGIQIQNIEKAASVKATNFLRNAVESEISKVSKEVKSAGELISCFEEEYGELPNFVTLGIDVLLPDTLKDAYTLTSGILQGNLTAEECWDAAKNILSESKFTKIVLVTEILDYGFEVGNERCKKMEKEVYQQLSEGDVLGAVFDGAEGFIDTVIAGSIEVLGNTASTMIDNVLEDIGDVVPVAKGINMITEYGTGLLGCNDGEGYSVGGLIGGITKNVSKGINAVTDIVTDTTDIITDTVTKGIKNGINWVKGWFD